MCCQAISTSTEPMPSTCSPEREAYRWNCSRQCLKKLGDDGVIAVPGDVFRFLKSCHQQYDFIFADPPYALKELATLPDAVLERGVLKEDGIFVLEHGKDYDFSGHPRYLEHRSYGSVNFTLFKF